MGDDIPRVNINPSHGKDYGQGMVQVFANWGLRESDIPTSGDTESPRVKERKVKQLGDHKQNLMVGKVRN